MCPACGQSKTERLRFYRTDYTLLRCLACGLRFSDPMKGEGDYSPTYERRRSLILANPPAALKRAAERWNIQVALQALGHTKRLLDIGCGTGQFLAIAREHGHQVAGLDFNPDSLRVAREVFGLTDLFCGSLNQFVQSDGRKFDAVVALEVLEHTEEPIEFLRQTASLLLPGSTLYLSVPGWNRWPRIFDPEADYPPHHLTYGPNKRLDNRWSERGSLVNGSCRVLCGTTICCGMSTSGCSGCCFLAARHGEDQRTWKRNPASRVWPGEFIPG